MSPFNLQLTPPQRISTRYGVRILQSAYPTSEFWEAWRSAKDSLKSQGFAVMKDSENNWRVNYYRQEQLAAPPPEVTGYQIRNVQCLLPYQAPHAGALCAALYKYGSALDASDTGTGKTYTALAVARELALIPAIVCLKTGIPAWERVTNFFGIKPLFIKNWEGCKSKKFGYGHWSQDEKYIWDIGRSKVLLILDEAHKAKGEYTQNAKMMIAAKHQNILCLPMSATIATTPREMRALGFLLGIHALSDFRQWTIGLGCYLNYFEQWECSDPKDAMTKVREEIFPAKGSRMRIQEISDFPETQITADVYPIEDADLQNEAYEKLCDEIARLKAQKAAGVNIQAAILTLALRYRQQAEALKVKLLASLIEEHLENGLSVAVFVNFRSTLEDLAEHFPGAALVWGEQQGAGGMRAREQAIDAFQSNKTRLILLTNQAGGASISLHDLDGNFPRVGLICPTYSANDLKQVLGRLHRAGGKSKSLQRIIYAAGTVENKVCQSVAKKLAALATLNDGDLAETDILGVLG